MTEKPQVILFSEEAKEAMRKQKLAHFSQEEIDKLTLTDEERAIHDKWLEEGKVNLPRQKRINKIDDEYAYKLRKTRIKELVCMLQGSVEGCIEFCYHPSLDRILERVMELKKEIEKIDD